MSHADYCSKFIPRGGSVLDIGAGRGKFLAEMEKLGFKIYGVETNPEYIGGPVIKALAEELPFPEKYFDFVNCAEVSEHVDDPVKMLKEIFRVLKPGGKCYISFHNRWGIYDYHYHLYFINWLPRLWTEPVLKFLNKEKKDGPAGRQKLTTMHYYIFSSVKKLLESTGFKTSDIRKEKIKDRFGFLSAPFLFFYFLFLRPFYFNTFHILLTKSKHS
ncbi:MAG: class I SAM-dependent methyltransferase [Candidatus Giovannonibacteria bacterium]|nr:class I SAM-dependent methyltransferase [Candidatus Giovannonibacteria bacterium]